MKDKMRRNEVILCWIFFTALGSLFLFLSLRIWWVILIASTLTTVYAYFTWSEKNE